MKRRTFLRVAATAPLAGPAVVKAAAGLRTSWGQYFKACGWPFRDFGCRYNEAGEACRCEPPTYSFQGLDRSKIPNPIPIVYGKVNR